MVWQAIRSHADSIASSLPVITSMLDVIDSKQNLTVPQAVALFATALDFKPDVILELGRGAGNSTALFAQAASLLSGSKVHSFCLSPHWHAETMPKLSRLVGARWFSPICIYTQDLTKYDFTKILAPSERVLIFWDAHGFEVAEHVLGHILPLVGHKPHRVLCHDICDRRVMSDDQLDYAGKRPWRGMTDYYDHPDEFAYLFVDWACGIVDQMLPILDFCVRNKINLHSADFEFREALKADGAGVDSVFGKLPGIDASTLFYYAWFTLNEAAGPLRFPRRHGQ